MLDKIATEHWIPFIIAKFEQTGKQISPELAEKIAVLMKNHPYYVQQLSHYVWELTSTDATIYILQQSVMRLLQVNAVLYQYEIENLSNTQVELLRAIISGETQLTAIRTMNNYRIGTPQNVSKNTKSLINQDIIEKHNNRTELLDPALELWFKSNFMNKKLDI